MPRLRNAATGAVVNVSDDTATRLSGYEPVKDDTKSSATKAPAKKSASGKSSSK